MNLLPDSASQWQAVADFFDQLAASSDRIPGVLTLAAPADTAQHDRISAEGA